jgi:hypothetical protein
MERVKKQIQTHLKNKKICVVIGKSRTGKSTLCDEILKNYDVVENTDKNVLSAKQQTTVASFFVNTMRKPVCLYLDALETHTERNMLEKCKNINELGYAVLINTTKTSGFPAYVEKVYMPSFIFPQQVEIHEPDVFYDIPYKTAQKMMNGWTTGTVPTEDMYYSDPFVLDGFIFDNYPNYTDTIERLSNASEILSYSDIFDGYKQRRQYYPIGGYVGMARTAHLANMLKKGMSANIKYFFPLLHTKYGKAKRREEKLKDRKLIMDVGAIFNTGDMLEKRKVPFIVYELDPEGFDAFEFKSEKKPKEINVEKEIKKENIKPKRKVKIVEEEEPKREPKEEPKREPKEEPKREPKEEPKREPKREPKEEPTNLQKKTIKELQEYCKSKSITGYSKYKKEELIQYILSQLNKNK